MASKNNSVKDVLFGRSVREKILQGVKVLADAVGTTLGPKGRNVLIDRGIDHPLITKDGITVAKSVSLPDRESDLGVRILREAAAKTGEEAGDGTTTATVLAEAIYSGGLQQLASGAAPIPLRRGIDKVVPLIIEELKKMYIPINDDNQIRQVGTIAANGETEIGEIMLQAFTKVGKDGVILIEESSRIRTVAELELIEGLQFDRGWVSYYMCNDFPEAIYENVLILISEKKLISARDLIKPLTIAQQGNRPVLIIAEDFSTEVINTLVVNRLKNGLAVVAVKAPGFGDRKHDMLEDIAAVTKAKIICDTTGVSLGDKFQKDSFGEAKKIIVRKEETIIVDGLGDPAEIQKRAQVVRDEIAKGKEEGMPQFQLEFLEVRLAKLTGGIARVSAGGATEAEMHERKDRLEDALYATRAAIAEGILPGGGVALLRAARRVVLDETKFTGDELHGAKLLLKALESPIRRISKNAGVSDDLVVARVLEEDGDMFGYNAATEKFEDLLVSGVIDPLKVVRSTLENAVSAAGTLLTTECMVVERSSEEED